MLACSGDTAEPAGNPSTGNPAQSTSTSGGADQNAAKGAPKDTEADPGETAGGTVEPPNCTPGPAGSFYALKVTTLFTKTELPFCAFQNKVVLIVNGASECGFTPQYGPLQDMYEKYHDVQKAPFEILAFPSNSFNQETGGEAEVSKTCVTAYSLTFPFAEIAPVSTKVRPADVIQPVYQWIYAQPGMSDQVDWNFEKYLIGKDGKVVRRISRSEGVAPGGVLDKAIEAELAK